METANTDFEAVEVAVMAQTVTEPPAQEERIVGGFNIMGTQCCGLHSISGFQYHINGETVPTTRRDEVRTPVTLKGFVKRLQLGYKKNLENNLMVHRDHERARNNWYAGTRQHPLVYPHPGYVNQPQLRAGMFLFTWNDKAYLPGAESLAKQIHEAGLGACTFTPPSRNPNSGNPVTAMIWCVDTEAYDRYVKENGL